MNLVVFGWSVLARHHMIDTRQLMISAACRMVSTSIILDFSEGVLSVLKLILIIVVGWFLFGLRREPYLLEQGVVVEYVHYLLVFINSK